MYQENRLAEIQKFYFDRTEVKLINKGKMISMFFEETDNFKKMREMAQVYFGYTKLNQFELYCEKYPLVELFDDLPIYKLNYYFSNDVYEILPVSDKNQLMEKEKLDLNGLLKIHKETVDNYMKIYDAEDSLKICYNDMNSLADNLTKIYDEICKEEELMKKHGLIDLHEKLSLKLEEETAKVKEKENHLSTKFVKILELKNIEKSAVEIIKSNKKLMSTIYHNSIKIEKKNKEKVRITSKQSALVKKKEHQAKLLENYLPSNNKGAFLGMINYLLLIEYIKLRFFRLYKNNVIMKIFNEKNILVYKPSEVKKICDTCNFENLFLSQLKRDEFYINYKEQLVIAIKHNVFLYHYKNSLMEKLKDLGEDHKGGSFIYVRHTNSIYCISGLASVLTEKLKLKKNFEISHEENWESVNRLIYPRSYFSTFVQNDCRIYLMLGFNLWDNEYLYNVDLYDTTSYEGWQTLQLKGEKIPRLTFSSCIASSDDEVFIVGGKDENHKPNETIYIYDVRKDKIEISKMKIPNLNNSDNDKMKNLFYQENCFVTLRPENDEFEKAIPLALFDSNNYLHLINMKNFDYSLISHDILLEFQVERNEESNDENLENDQQEEINGETEKFNHISLSKNFNK